MGLVLADMDEIGEKLETIYKHYLSAGLAALPGLGEIHPGVMEARGDDPKAFKKRMFTALHTGPPGYKQQAKNKLTSAT